jgi:hypothetical protein
VIGNEKRSVDWILTDGDAALFIECKVKRLTWEAKENLNDLAALEGDLDNMATAIVQTYKTIRDYLHGHYPHFPFRQGTNIFACIVTLENWHMHGPVMYGKISELVGQKLTKEGLPPSYVSDMPYSIWPVASLENGLQIVNAIPITEMLNAKLKINKFKDWEWDAFFGEKFKDHKIRALFAEDFQNLFSELHP